MGCSACDPVDVGWEIRVPDDLTRAVAAARRAVESGVLRDAPADSVVASAFGALRVDGPWPDVVDCRLRCVHCGAAFLLAAETYHGSGGRWVREAARA
ncbi:MAG: hypothetical protein AAGB93_00810 [Planctomycetota bacterium]